MEILRKGHEAYVLAVKRLGDKHNSAVRAMPYDARIGALEQRKGNKTASMGKSGMPAPKTMDNTIISLEGKRGIESLLKEHGLESILIKFQFKSVANLLTEGMFRVYKRDQVVPFALEFKCLSSRSEMECPIKTTMGLGFKSERETLYKRKDDCQISLTYTKRKDDRTFIKDSSRVRLRKWVTFVKCMGRA